MWAAVEVIYGKAHELLKKFTGLEVSRKKIHQMPLGEGRRIKQWEEERRRDVFEQAKETEAEASFSERVLVSKGRVWLMDKKSYASIEGATTEKERLTTFIKTFDFFSLVWYHFIPLKKQFLIILLRVKPLRGKGGRNEKDSFGPRTFAVYSGGLGTAPL